MFKNLTVQEFVDELSSKKATPGGGSASAVVGSIGVGLISMYCEITAKSKKFVDVKEDMEQQIEFLTAFKEKCLVLADKDTEAFNEVMAAFKLPKETDDEKAARKQAIQDATKQATEVPLEMVAAMVPVLQLVPSLIKKGNPNALSDLQVGMEMCYTAMSGAAANVEINLPSIKDTQFKERVEEELLHHNAAAQKAMDEAKSLFFPDSL
ncbi:cyclodeaminase/cyclohydrolase family protein [Proteinivorax tanatarense]|uniref:Cyclodeaminase/cyclohydrolase family protein n=1 Tax=Proteinivorax tanatarense TaxID=1260629 RepID=A0AAU7VPR0_9FIRM